MRQYHFASSQWMKTLELKNSFLILCDSLFHPKNIVNCLLFSHNLLFYKTLISSKDLLLTSTNIPQIKHQHLISDYLRLLILSRTFFKYLNLPVLQCYLIMMSTRQAL